MKNLSIAFFSGLLVSLALFWLMQTMISNNQQALVKTENLQMTEFVRLKRETKLQTKERIVPEKPKPEKRPPPPQMQMQQVHISQNTVPAMNMPKLDIPIHSQSFNQSAISGVQVGIGGVSSNVIPLVRIPPRYPMRAANRRVEGWVKVEFTITKDGSVKDAIVVDAQPDKVFNRAALQAIKRWKFKAKVIAGEAFEQRAVQVLQFKLTK